MSKNEYMQELRGRIAHLPVEEQEAALTYYFEYLEELGEENIEQAIRELGTPREVAERIIADYTQRMAAGETGAPGSQGERGCLTAALFVMASPLIFAFAAVVLALIIVVVIITCIPLIIGVTFFFAGIWVLFVHVGTGLVMLGGSLISTGLFCLMTVPIINFWQFMIRFFRRKKYEKIRKRTQTGYTRASYSNNYSQTAQPKQEPHFTENHDNPMEPPNNF